MGSGAGGGEEVRGAPGGRAVGRRLIRLVVVGAIAIVAVVLLAPQIRDLAETDDDDNDIPEGFDIFRAASNGTDVLGVGGVLDGDTANPRAFAFRDGEWQLTETPDNVGVFGDIAMDGDRVVMVGSASRGRATVWTATLPDLDWEREETPALMGDFRGIAIKDETIVAVGSTTLGTAVVLVRSDAGTWQLATLPGERAVPIAVVATADGFVAGGSAANAPAMWTSPDGLEWISEAVSGSTGSVQGLAASGNGSEVMAIGVNDRIHVAFAVNDRTRTPIALPTEDAGEFAFAIAPTADGWVVVGQDIDVGDVAHAIMWTGDPPGHHWSLNERVAADRLTDVVVVKGRPFGVGSLERAGQLTPVLIPL